MRGERANRMYSAWQQKNGSTKSVHLFKFADEAAYGLHGSSEAVPRLEEVYGREPVSVVPSSSDLIPTKRVW